MSRHDLTAPPASPIRKLGVLSLAMINLAAMDGIRNLPALSTYGWAAIFFYALAVLFFLIPVAYTSAELATGWPESGGVYAWVREAFGTRWGFLAVWCDWSENVVWFPTVLLFVSTTAAFAIAPEYATNKVFLVIVMLVAFWGVTLVNFLAATRSTTINSIALTVGTLVPSAAIILLGIYWLGSGRPSEIPFSAGALVPDFDGFSSLVFIASILVAFAGMEMSGFHARFARNPTRDYPRAILLSAVTIATISALGSVAIAVVVPNKELGLVSGVMQAFQQFFDDFGIGWAVRPVAAIIVLGVLAQLSTWIIGPARGLHRAAQEGELPPVFHRVNRNGSPVNILVIQAVFGTLVALLLFLVDSVQTYYWMLTALVAQIFIVMYLLMYASVLKLRRTQPDTPRACRIPGGTFGLYVIVGTGIVGGVFTFILGFIPASHLGVDEVPLYVGIMVVGFLAVFAPALVFGIRRKPAWADPIASGVPVEERTVKMGDEA